MGRSRRIQGYEEGSNDHVFGECRQLRRLLPVQRGLIAGGGGGFCLLFFELRILRDGNYRSLFTKRILSLPVCLT